MTFAFPETGLYAITETGQRTPEQVESAVVAAIRGGVRVVQFRDKSMNERVRLETAARLVRVCRDQHIPLIINDDIALAVEVGANGVHLGRDDADIEAAFRLLGRDSIVGISCYDSLPMALQAEQQGASYVAFGRFFSSASKPAAGQAHLHTLIEARQQLSVPIVAIGGITSTNGECLLEAGADVLAVINSLFSDSDPEQAASQFQSLFRSRVHSTE